MARIREVTGRRVTPLADGWEMTVGGDGRWIPAPVPGTAAQALQAAGLWTLDAPTPLHDRDVLYRTRLSGDGPGILRFQGLATLAEVTLDGRPILDCDSMYLSHDVPVTLAGEALLEIRFRALHPVLSGRKGRARWRPKMIEPASLRFARTTLLGHMPGWCPSVHAVGPWRPVELVEEDGPVRVRAADLRTGFDGRAGTLSLTLTLADTPGRLPAELEVGGHVRTLEWLDDRTLRAEAVLPGIEPWWPHTHGRPALHPLSVRIGDSRVDLGRVGFRSIERAGGPDGQGFGLRINGEPVFCRGACWTPADIVSLPGTREAYEPILRRVAGAGMNMVRVGGTMVYESDAFFELCDELGILVWQDFMFANFDYPADPAYRESVRAEAAQFLDRIQGSPSLAVLCGGSEAEQQAAMLGLPREAWSQPVFTDILPGEAARLRPDVPYVTNSPSGGPLPFAADAGVTHYYGVGAYQRPLEDARRAGVRFASECLAFANVPEETAAGVPAVHHPRWKERVPRDLGASWDFEDVRDHYLQRLYGVEPNRLRYEDQDRYLRLSRAVTAEVMEATFGEWRRVGSSCGGGLVWLLRDLWPGAGWGVLDAAGRPKAAWYGLRRAFRPLQVILTDEGVNGLAVHLLNETAEAVPAVLTLTALRHGEVAVARAERAVTLPARSSQVLSSAELLGRFFDWTYAYRFGPPAHDVTVAILSQAGTDGTAAGEPLAEAFHFPNGRALPRSDLGLAATVAQAGEDWVLTLRTQRLACSVHVEDERFRAEDAWFHLPPGRERRLRLSPRDGGGGGVPDGEVHALNALAPIRFRG
ncbi:glycosyl hydrolase 2 galactose-binding domain-containing protein [Azospirillum thermophilum]|uniref:Beta-mannosidase n=1 Tax=Azospirillum thermophilum TaxID=2202148 RepID=A0A2S2CKN4_9PROT|nr:glycoside hydrolase family 2 protein [Azospirillum thermophilum]AWK85075.1 beta-mannosidase [Azospirillum thermophilum]